MDTSMIWDSRRIGLVVLVIVLYVITFVGAGLAALSLGYLAVETYYRVQVIDPERWHYAYEAGAVARVTLWVSGMVAGSYIIASMEYHTRRFGQRTSWKVFAWTLAVELALIVACRALTGRWFGLLL